MVVVVVVPAPEAVVPVHGRGPDGAGHGAREEGGGGVPVVGVGIGVVAYRLVGVARFIEHLRLILRHVDDFAARRLDDDVLAAVVLFLGHLDLVVGLDDAVGHRLLAQLLDGVENIFLLVDDRLAEKLGPVEVIGHHLDDLGIVQQRDHAAVPGGLGLEVLLGLRILEEALGLDDLQGIERGGRNQRHELVGVKGDAGDEDVHFLGRQRLRRLVGDGGIGGSGLGGGLGTQRRGGGAQRDHRRCGEQKRPGQKALQIGLVHIDSHNVRGLFAPRAAKP